MSNYETTNHVVSIRDQRLKKLNKLFIVDNNKNILLSTGYISNYTLILQNKVH